MRAGVYWAHSQGGECDRVRGQQKHWGFQRKSESRWQVDKSVKDSKAVCRVAELNKGSRGRQAVTGTRDLGKEMKAGWQRRPRKQEQREGRGAQFTNC